MTWLDLIPLTLTKLTPLLLTTLGGLFSERSGVINFALEGMMLTGAFFAVWLSFLSGSPWVGLAVGATGGMAIAFLHAFFCLKLRTNHILSSIALNLLAAGVTGVLLNEVFGVYGTSPAVRPLPKLSAQTLAAFPIVGPGLVVFAGLPILVPVSLIAGLLIAVFFKYTTLGLRIKACGENPLAADAAGISVVRLRFFAVLMSGLAAGCGGAYLAIGELSQFVENMTGGRGYLAVAALILGRWHPAGIILATVFFSLLEALSELLAVTWSGFPSQIFLAFPYLVCLVALTCWVGKRHPPSALGQM
jgi:general nucleoside transport system permease protein